MLVVEKRDAGVGVRLQICREAGENGNQRREKAGPAFPPATCVFDADLIRIKIGFLSTCSTSGAIADRQVWCYRRWLRRQRSPTDFFSWLLTTRVRQLQVSARERGWSR